VHNRGIEVAVCNTDPSAVPDGTIQQQIADSNRALDNERL
jgi:hypothetical protein